MTEKSETGMLGLGWSNAPLTICNVYHCSNCVSRPPLATTLPIKVGYVVITISDNRIRNQHCELYPCVVYVQIMMLLWYIATDEFVLFGLCCLHFNKFEASCFGNGFLINYAWLNKLNEEKNKYKIKTVIWKYFSFKKTNKKD